MDIIKTTQDLMRFKSETGNIGEINKIIAYIENIFAKILYLWIHKNIPID